jgi:hypothetical protein
VAKITFGEKNMNMANLPRKGSGVAVECKRYSPDEIIIQNTEGTRMFSLRNTSEKTLFEDIARAILETRDLGFEQGRESIRNAIGIR